MNRTPGLYRLRQKYIQLQVELSGFVRTKTPARRQAAVKRLCDYIDELRDLSEGLASSSNIEPSDRYRPDAQTSKEKTYA